MPRSPFEIEIENCRQCPRSQLPCWMLTRGIAGLRRSSQVRISMRDLDEPQPRSAGEEKANINRITHISARQLAERIRLMRRRTGGEVARPNGLSRQSFDCPMIGWVPERHGTPTELPSLRQREHRGAQSGCTKSHEQSAVVRMRGLPPLVQPSDRDRARSGSHPLICNVLKTRIVPPRLDDPQRTRIVLGIPAG